MAEAADSEPMVSGLSLTESLATLGLTSPLKAPAHLKSFSQPDGTTLTFPGVDGVPFRGTGPAPYFKQNEIEKLEREADGKARIFNLMDNTDMVEYNRIINNVAKGIAAISQETKPQWLDNGNKCLVFMRWVEYAMERPGSRYERVQADDNGQISFG